MAIKNVWSILSKTDPSASLDSEETRNLALLIEESEVSLNQALEELEDVQSQISMLVEAAKESHSQVQRHLSTLSSVASYRGTNLVTLLQQYRSVIEKARAEDRSAPEPVPLVAGAGGLQFEPAPWPEDQG